MPAPGQRGSGAPPSGPEAVTRESVKHGTCPKDQVLQERPDDRVLRSPFQRIGAMAMVTRNWFSELRLAMGDGRTHDSGDAAMTFQSPGKESLRAPGSM